ncbi:MAG: hypothetical protein AUJ85_09020 [Elusimicrobia bacterium CG1_02_37_114]|nr:MAG: hypothetical protein AUJ85_09020 [Elusimicrobia bacterium CG1_02_37_114]PIV53530.1 MAG: hypothetical protein COS17_03375 [Elusimicrobia bacterium CG02_land_8_20_14_3_00_37_13]PIZ12705.1 MAG: hypothetical protein COY53_08605 [Elusimicrobia bacterium CG_4_10_14_0_8_um_filter_37_32]
MAYADTLKVFGVLRKKFDEASSEAIATAVETALETNNAAMLDKVATKDDLRKLEIKIEQVKSELIKWMFIFWIGQFASITTVLFLFFKR